MPQQLQGEAAVILLQPNQEDKSTGVGPWLPPPFPRAAWLGQDQCRESLRC